MLTFVKKFARETTNDMGDTINLATAKIIIVEFKKFLFLVALRLIYDKEKKYQKEINGKIQYTCPFPAPPMINKVWDLLILYSDNYMELCNSIFNGFLHKPKFSDDEEEFKGYDYMYRLLIRKKRLLHPFWNMWPKYPMKEFYFSDRDS